MPLCLLLYPPRPITGLAEAQPDEKGRGARVCPPKRDTKVTKSDWIRLGRSLYS